MLSERSLLLERLGNRELACGRQPEDPATDNDELNASPNQLRVREL